jgi:hypothetical protein
MLRISIQIQIQDVFRILNQTKIFNTEKKTVKKTLKDYKTCLLYFKGHFGYPGYRSELILVNVKYAQESIPPDWESIPRVLKRFTNTRALIPRAPRSIAPDP